LIPAYLQHAFPTSDSPVLYQLGGALIVAATVVNCHRHIMQGQSAVYRISRSPTSALARRAPVACADGSGRSVRTLFLQASQAGPAVRRGRGGDGQRRLGGSPGQRRGGPGRVSASGPRLQAEAATGAVEVQEVRRPGGVSHLPARGGLSHRKGWVSASGGCRD